MNAPTFWCHECQATITPNNMNCPTCGGGFIEPLDSGDGSRPQDYEIPGAQPQQPGRTQSYAQGEQANYAPGFGPFQELWQFLRNPAISGQAGTGQGQRGTQVFTHTFHLGNGGNVQAVGYVPFFLDSLQFLYQPLDNFCCISCTSHSFAMPLACTTRTSLPNKLQLLLRTKPVQIS